MFYLKKFELSLEKNAFVCICVCVCGHECFICEFRVEIAKVETFFASWNKK